MFAAKNNVLPYHLRAFRGKFLVLRRFGKQIPTSEGGGLWYIK